MKRISIIISVLFIHLVTYAQVTIGSSEKPLDGSLLDLKENGNIGANSTKGLLLPRVALQEIFMLEPIVPTTTANKLAHIGLTLFNVTNSGVLKSGVYGWDGESWIKLSGKKTIGFGPWYQINSLTPVPSYSNTTNSYMHGKVVVNGNSILNNSQLSVYGNASVSQLAINLTSVDTKLGLKLPTTAAKGKVLSTDKDGNTMWSTSGRQLQTLIYGSKNGIESYKIDNPSVNNTVKLETISTINFDEIASAYPGYGWDATSLIFKAPVTGRYKITYRVYLDTKTVSSQVNIGQINKIQIYKNGSILNDAGMLLLVEESTPVTGVNTAIVNLKKGDALGLYLEVVDTTNKAKYVNLYSASGYSFLFVETL